VDKVLAGMMVSDIIKTSSIHPSIILVYEKK